MNTQYKSTLAIIKILTVIGITAVLSVSCSNTPNINANLLKSSRPIETTHPNVKPTTRHISGAIKSNDANADAIKQAKQTLKKSNEESKAYIKNISNYKSLIEELRPTDAIMAAKFTKLTKEYEDIDKTRIVVINELRDELSRAAKAATETSNALDYADKEIMQLSQEVDASWNELSQQRKQRAILEAAIIKSQKSLDKSKSETEKYKKKYQKLTKYKWIASGLSIWIIFKIVIGLSSFMPQGHNTKTTAL